MVNSLKGYALLTPVNQQIPSPDGAAAIIEKLNKIYGIDVKTDLLLSEAQKIKDKLAELNVKTRESHRQIPTMTESSDNKNLYL
jgi:predicted ATP-grasp superfamily ATP-dependent carboligase